MKKTPPLAKLIEIITNTSLCDKFRIKHDELTDKQEYQREYQKKYKRKIRGYKKK